MCRCQLKAQSPRAFHRRDRRVRRAGAHHRGAAFPGARSDCQTDRRRKDSGSGSNSRPRGCRADGRVGRLQARADIRRLCIRFKKRTIQAKERSWINFPSAAIRSLGTAHSSVMNQRRPVRSGMARNFWQLSPNRTLTWNRPPPTTAKLTLLALVARNLLLLMDYAALHDTIIATDSDASYEDYQEGYSTATGVARTHEIIALPHSWR